LIENESGRILEANSAASALYGYGREELLTIRNVDLSAEPEDTRHVTRETPVVVEQVVTVPLRLHRKKDGTVFPVEITGRFFDWQGRSVHIAAIRDISERIQAEEALRESEARYRSLFEHSPIPLWEEDFSEVKRYIDSLRAKGVSDLRAHFEDHPDAVAHCVGLIKIVDVNSATLNLYRADSKEALSNLGDVIILEETLDLFREALLVFVEGQTTWEGENPQITLTGDRLDIYGSTVILPGYEETWSKVIISTFDITDRKRAEEERDQLLAHIQEQAHRVQQIIDTVPEGVLLLDQDQRIVLANPVAGGHLSLLAGVKVRDTLTHLGSRPLAELLTPPPRGLWHEVATDDRCFQVIARPNEAGPALSGWVLVIRDVTQQREIEQRIQQQERLASVGQLAAGIAHDFNNIMATIVLYAQMTARTEGLPSVIRERMETIDQQAGHATNLIQQILDFSRRAVLDRHPLDLIPLLREHVKLLERTLPENIRVRLDCEPDRHAAPLIVNADPTRMQQMVTNLALNARDAMPDGGELRIGLERIEVRQGESPLLPEMAAGEWVLVSVSDTGTGIPPNVLPHIFEPFFTSRAPLGSGLGLAQVHGIVGQHGGRIDVDTHLGEGTTFTIYLPVHVVEPTTAASLGGLTALLTGQGETVLVVEDDAVVRKALLDSLEELNYTALEAVNGQEALTLLEEFGDEVGLLLSDVVMPGMGGMALLHALGERGLRVPVVMLTGHPLERELEGLQARGLLDWLPKPPTLEELAKVVARALSKE
jgi:PAS domain S-box-containing protein